MRSKKLTQVELEKAYKEELLALSKRFNYYNNDLEMITIIYGKRFVRDLVIYLTSDVKEQSKWNELVDMYYLHGDFDHFKDLIISVTSSLIDVININVVYFVLNMLDDIS